MPFRINPFTGNLDYYETGGGGGGGSTVTITHVANYTALPDPTTVGLDEIYIADASQGTSWLPGTLGGTYYPAGTYFSNGTIWIYSTSPYQATLAEVNTGTDTDKYVTPSTFINADKWDTKLDVNSSISEHNDVIVTTPILDQVLKWNGSQWINSSGSSVSAGPGVVYFLTDNSAGFGTYEYMSKTPDSGPEIEESVILNNNTVLFHEYISDGTIGKTFIDPGIWEFNLFGQADLHSASFVVDVYKRTSGGTETILFSTETDHIDKPDITLTSSTTVQPQFSCNTTDSLVIKISGKTTFTADITFKLIHSGTTHYSHIHLPLVLPHNSIAGLQGGATDEYYHLDSATNTKLNNWVTTGVPDADIQSAADWSGKQDALINTTNIKSVNGSSLLGSGNLTVGDALTSGKLSQFASTSSSELAGVISDETGSGALVFANAPTLTNPIVGTQTANDNSTKAASTAYVDTAISSVVSSPDALNGSKIFGYRVNSNTQKAYKLLQPIVGSTMTTGTLNGESIYCYKFYADPGSVINEIALRVMTAGAAGLGLAQVRFLIYRTTLNANGEIVGGDLELDTGTSMATTSTGVKSVTGLNHTLSSNTHKNVWFMAIRNYQSGSLSLKFITIADVLSNYVDISSSSTAAAEDIGWYFSCLYNSATPAAMPSVSATSPTTTAVASVAGIPAVGYSSY